MEKKCVFVWSNRRGPSVFHPWRKSLGAADIHRCTLSGWHKKHYCACGAIHSNAHPEECGAPPGGLTTARLIYERLLQLPSCSRLSALRAAALICGIEVPASRASARDKP
jgi:hypothetical protein